MIVLTLGTFDLFHAGHVQLLRRCRDLAAVGTVQRVVVGLNTDAFVERYKGKPPVIAYEDREWCLWACRYVDAVLPNQQSAGDAKDVIEAIGPDLIAIGDDWRDRDYLAQLGVSAGWLDSRRIRVVYLPYTPGISTTEIRERLA